MAQVQWYPGHMKKAGREMEESLPLVDVVCEIADARVPVSSRNPDLDRILRSKPRLLILNRADQADPAATALWTEYYTRLQLPFLCCDSKSGRGLSSLSERLHSLRSKTGPLRAMVVGVPNVGKSTFINRVSGRKSAAVSDRPGVTRGRQWVTVDAKLELLDTPGILWPKFEDPSVGEHLAFTGAVKDTVFDVEDLAARLAELLRALYPGAMNARYGIAEDPDLPGWQLVEAMAAARGFRMARGLLNTERMSAVLLDEFRGGKLGRMTLERPC